MTNAEHGQRRTDDHSHQIQDPDDMHANIANKICNAISAKLRLRFKWKLLPYLTREGGDILEFQESIHTLVFATIEDTPCTWGELLDSMSNSNSASPLEKVGNLCYRVVRPLDEETREFLKDPAGMQLWYNLQKGAMEELLD